MTYFQRTGPDTFRPTEHVGGAWNTAEQHIAPILGVLTHAVEKHRDERRDDGLVIGRVAFEILGTLPMEEVQIDVEVRRPGRTVELVEATATHKGRAAVLLRAWLLHGSDTTAEAGTALPSIPGPDDTKPWDAPALWPGGFINSVEVRRNYVEPGRGQFWVKARPDLLDEDVSVTARFLGLVDIANGMAVRADPSEMLFPNLDLSAHLFRQPAGEWVGFDTTVTFGAGGVGLTSSVLHDVAGPIGTLQQLLTLRLVKP